MADVLPGADPGGRPAEGARHGQQHPLGERAARAAALPSPPRSGSRHEHSPQNSPTPHVRRTRGTSAQIATHANSARTREDGGVPEGDTVWNTARVLHRALAGARLTGSDFRVPQLATTDLAGWTVARVGQPGQAPAAAPRRPGRRGPDAALAPADGRRLAGVRARGTLGRPAGAPDPGGAAQPRTRSRSATTCTSWPWCRPPRRTGWSATSAPTCSARTGTRPRRSAGSPPTRTRPSARRCSTSATWPGSATSTSARCCSCAASRRGRRSARCPTSPAWWPGAEAAGRQPGPLDAEHHRFAAPGRRPATSTAAAPSRAAAAAPPIQQGGAGRTGHLLVPGLPARASGRTVTRLIPAHGSGPAQIRTIG